MSLQGARMTDKMGSDRWTGVLRTMPAGVRVMLTAFLAIVGAGYLMAVGNVWHTHQLADGEPGLTLNDLRATYSGMTVSGGDVMPSRMLLMIRTQMRGYVTDADFAILEGWLSAGGSEAGLDEGETTRQTPRRAIIRNCLRCHAESTETEISRRAAFGPDEFSVEYGMLAPHLAGDAPDSGEVVHVPPQLRVSRLVLVSHAHMLAMPMFALAVALLFMTTRLPWRLRAVLIPVPMIALILDFAGWWLARLSEGFVLLIVGAGAAFGLVLGFQVLTVVVDMWRPCAGGPCERRAPVRERH